MGPCGGGGGDVWEMDVRGVDRIVKVVLWHSGAVDAISVSYERDGREEQAKHRGKPEGHRSEICLEPGEYLVGVKGNLGNFGGCFLLGTLTFISNLRTFGPYGTREGPPFDLPAAGGKIVGFHGRSGGLLDALGTYVSILPFVLHEHVNVYCTSSPDVLRMSKSIYFCILHVARHVPLVCVGGLVA
ncbi:jacalin-related lectin 19-like [Triticum aestivum]|uniref:jacalin-related lectin 19-like n=1 Tax=Triticum aestivum TaxID=4565 RepID=UPI000842369B|nr:jacalin-related lectin 19-like [Triticum aestivum]